MNNSETILHFIVNLSSEYDRNYPTLSLNNAFYPLLSEYERLFRYYNVNLGSICWWGDLFALI